MNKHTPGPWKSSMLGGGKGRPNEYSIRKDCPESDRGEFSIATTHRFTGVAGANARRIVACVNALEGIDDPAAARALLDDPRTVVATDMHQALLQIRLLADNWFEKKGDESAEIFRIATEVLKKAEGR